MKKLLLTFLAGFFLIGTSLSAGAAEPGDELPAKVIAAGVGNLRLERLKRK
ncbi:hypothetical protein [Paenibacillus larvae]|uniref:hypothetical protein n=1 Tax=Paenibacillus larvae TaxID=1464 RepID=UPI00288F0D8A|nr:hypothetical protein [Paenibacillus larvae]MDT2193469.1 hypothetical protein [Paenibacillus larvae]